MESLAPSGTASLDCARCVEHCQHEADRRAPRPANLGPEMRNPTPMHSAGSQWTRDDVLSDLWQWFCALDLQERIQAIAIEDALWIKMYIVLFRKTEKQQHRTVFDLACESRAASDQLALARVIRIFRADCERIYDRALHHERLKQSSAHTDAGGSHGTAHDAVRAMAPCGASVTTTPNPNPAPKRTLGIASSVASNTCVASGVASNMWEDVKRQSLANVMRQQQQGAEQPQQQDDEAIAISAGKHVMNQVQLCSVSAPLDTLTLAESAVIEAPRLLELLRRATKDDFLSRPLPAHFVKQMALTPSSSCASSSGEPNGKASGHIQQTAWLDAKNPASLHDMLVSRIELSLWSSYWRAVHRSFAPVRSVALSGLRDKWRQLAKFWDSLDESVQLSLLSSNPPALKCFEANKGDGTPTSEIVRRLLFTPVRWACALRACFELPSRPVALSSLPSRTPPPQLTQTSTRARRRARCWSACKLPALTTTRASWSMLRPPRIAAAAGAQAGRDAVPTRQQRPLTATPRRRRRNPTERLRALALMIRARSCLTLLPTRKPRRRAVRSRTLTRAPTAASSLEETVCTSSSLRRRCPPSPPAGPPRRTRVRVVEPPLLLPMVARRARHVTP